MCAERPKDAVRSPWTEGAWIMRERDIPADWVWRWGTEGEEWNSWRPPYGGDDWPVEARPATEADQ